MTLGRTIRDYVIVPLTRVAQHTNRTTVPDEDSVFDRKAGQMTLKSDLIRIGYLPENLPPSFHSEGVAIYFDANPATYLSGGEPVRSANYNASKRGMARRNFSAVHPVIAHDLAEFIHTRSNELDAFLANARFSMSVPHYTPEGDRALTIATHSELEEKRLSRLSGYRFIAKTDISRFYHSIYTHSVPWAFHGKAVAKADRNFASEAVFCNRLDYTLRQGQDGQTVGIPVGPDASRYIAELVAEAIDREFALRCDVRDLAIIRHVDDVWIGAQTHADAERALWRYREALREFELDINESKTAIYEGNFRFSDTWPTDISNRIEMAIDGPASRQAERLRAALEYAFSLAASEHDDGILKYAIRQLDRPDLYADAWLTLQPFLMRSAVHFGHTVDYVARVLVWRELTKGDLDRARWTAIFHSILDRHGRLGNDSEVCWSLYTALRLRIEIPEDVGQNIVRNCGALSILALLNCVDGKLAPRTAFDTACERLSQESANGPMWPLFLEWLSRAWPRNGEVRGMIHNELIEAMARAGVTIFDPDRLTRVFGGVDELDFSRILSAIETRTSLYDDDETETGKIEF